MKITNVRVKRYSGRLDRDVGLTPLSCGQDPGDRNKGAEHGDKRLILETDAGITGVAPHVHGTILDDLKSGLREWLIGRDPLAVERNWLELREVLTAKKAKHIAPTVSRVDWAMWDLRGKAMDAPVYSALGGPGRDRIRTYGSTAGLPNSHCKDLMLIRDLALQIKEKGFYAQKWFLTCDPEEGEASKQHMTDMVRILREALGEDHILMLDAVCHWDLPYALDMAERLAEFKPYWLEDPVPPEPSDDWARLRDATDIPLAGCDRLPDRWAFQHFLEKDLVEFVQVDESTTHGITEMNNVVTLASAYRRTIAPHCGYPATQHLLAAIPAPMDPWYEHLMNWNEYGQWFLKHRNEPENGTLPLPPGPGLGTDIDMDRVEKVEDLF